MSITELLPQISSLPHADKFRLVDLLLKQLAKEGGVSLEQPTSVKAFDPREFFGAAKASKQEVDEHLEELRSGWS